MSVPQSHGPSSGSSDRPRILGAIALIVVGVLGLLSSVGVLDGLGGLFGLVLFGGLAVLALGQGRRTGQFLWRAAALPLAGLAIASVTASHVGGAAFLGSIGLAFGLAWREDERRWWALIPAGTLLALALTAYLDGFRVGAAVSGSVFLLGLAATFFALTRLRVEPQGWAVFPAVGLAVLAVFSASAVGGWLLPIGFIAVGVWLLWRSGALPGVPGPGSTPRTQPFPPPVSPAPGSPSSMSRRAPAPEATLATAEGERPDSHPSPEEARLKAELRLDDDGAPRP
ncbi:MAG: hypothetical protein P1P87_06440 [Trueperaceae bacterium]|nr:hypothetical protein [Trueperaceae bacterium]